MRKSEIFKKTKAKKNIYSAEGVSERFQKKPTLNFVEIFPN